MKKNMLLALICLCSAITIAQVPQIERDALMALYNSTDGANWVDNTNWGSANPVSTWFGVTVENIGGADHVTWVDLTSNNLSGTLPLEVGNLSELTLFILFNNNISGTLSPTIGNCVKLEFLDFAANNFEGDIPSEYQNLTHLEVLFFESNNLSGDVTNIYTYMPNLRILGLEYNSLTGELDLSQNQVIERIYADSTLIAKIDPRNGNNPLIQTCRMYMNPNLTCIFVDDKNNITSNWQKDPTATYVETQAECDALGTEEFSTAIFKIYPNPTKNFLFINSQSTIETVSVYDIFGKLAKNFPAQNKYDVSGLSKGMYIINIKSEAGNSVEKLVIE